MVLLYTKVERKSNADILPPGVEEEGRTSAYWVLIQADPPPYVLSDEAVEEDWLPPKGVSALPAAVRRKAPKELRYWEQPREKALESRRKLAGVEELGGAETKQGRWVTIRGRPVFIGGRGGGGGGGGGGRSKPLGAPPMRGSGSMSKELEQAMSDDLPVPEGYDPSDVEYMDWENIDDEVAAAVKAQVAEQLASQTGRSPEETATFVNQWAMTSNDTDMRSLSIQQAASEEFGNPLSEFQQDRIREAQNRGGAYAESLMPAAQQREALRAMYDATQSDLEAHGLKPDGTVRLFRGVKFGDEVSEWEDGNTARYEGNALESWSLSPDAAREFSDGVIFVADVPVSSILSTPRTGFGCFGEAEVVIFGSVGGSEVLVWNEAAEE